MSDPSLHLVKKPPPEALARSDRLDVMIPALVALRAIVIRESLRFVRQRSRFVAALVRPLLWLVVFAAGFRAALGLSITPPYQTYTTYEV